ncbi:MAG: PilZ domain-containing protein [Planctomycetes bacterium]|nr:PilZ domain-containing protein [Planctomycetota bacterium]
MRLKPSDKPLCGHAYTTNCMATLQEITDSVVRRAQRLGYVVQRDIRLELKQAGLPESQWQDVVQLAQGRLNYRQGRYHHIQAVSPKLQQEQRQQQLVQRAIRKIMRESRQARQKEDRRQQDRIDFIQVVVVQTEDGRQHTLLSRDLSLTGIRLIGTRRFLGQKLQVRLSSGETASSFLVRVLWTCAIGDDLFENGGNFVELLPT